MDSFFNLISKLSGSDPIFVVVLLLLLIAFIVISGLPTIFCFCLLKEFKDLGSKFVEKFEGLISEVRQMKDQLHEVKDGFLEHKATLDFELRQIKESRKAAR